MNCVCFLFEGKKKELECLHRCLYVGLLSLVHKATYGRVWRG